MDSMFEKRKKLIYEFICDEFYVPMKLKELAILLQVPKEQKSELKSILDALRISNEKLYDEAICSFLRKVLSGETKENQEK